MEEFQVSRVIDLLNQTKKKQSLYIDAKNLYGWAMSQYLPTGTFEKLYPREYSRECTQHYELEEIVEDSRFIPDNKPYGFIIVGESEYPAEIKEKTENFPLCPYQTKADPGCFSDYMNSVKQPNYKPTQKLVCDLTNKQTYMLHYISSFTFYTKIGMKVTHFHSIFRFKQSPWLAKYIAHNTQKRTKAKTNYEKDLYKLKKKAFFGKTTENVRDRVNLEFIDHSQVKQIIKRQSKLSFKGIVDWYSVFSVYKFDKEKTVFDKPIYLGFTILELSKLLMYEFYYNTSEPHWQNNVQLHFMDTDSFVVSFESQLEDLIEFLKQNNDEFDFSELNNAHQLYNPIDKKVIGK